MIFETRDEWEVADPIYKQMIGSIGVHRYPVLKVALNFKIFHVEVCRVYTEEELEIWERYIFAFIEDIVKTILAGKQERIRISLQSDYDVNGGGDYYISRVTEIIEYDDNGRKFYMYKCKNGQIFSDAPDKGDTTPSANKKVVYTDYS